MNNLTNSTTNNPMTATMPTQDMVQIDQSALARLREKARINTELTVWKPEPGDVLEGVIVGSRKVEGPFGEQDQAIVQTPAGAVVAVWLTSWILGQLRAQAAEIGDLLSLSFLGKGTGARGMTYNRMSITVLKP